MCWSVEGKLVFLHRADKSLLSPGLDPVSLKSRVHSIRLTQQVHGVFDPASFEARRALGELLVLVFLGLNVGQHHVGTHQTVSRRGIIVIGHVELRQSGAVGRPVEWVEIRTVLMEHHELTVERSAAVRGRLIFLLEFAVDLREVE